MIQRPSPALGTPRAGGHSGHFAGGTLLALDGAMLRLRLIACALVCAVSTACNSDKGDTSEDGATDTDTASTDDTPTTGEPAACDLPGVKNTLCATIEVTCMEGQDLADPAALACALAAMRDRTSGKISLYTCENAGQNSSEYVWELRADGTARRHYGGQSDFCSLQGRVEEVMLAEPAFYADCLDQPDWQSQIDCLLEATSVGSCEPGVEECHDGV